MMKIPIFKLDFENDFIREYQDKCRDIFTSNRPLTESNYVTEFENKFSVLVGSKYSIAVSNGTEALDIALKTAGVGMGDEVLLPSMSYISTASSICYQNAVPVFIDIENETFNMNPKRIEEAILDGDIENTYDAAYQYMLDIKDQILKTT